MFIPAIAMLFLGINILQEFGKQKSDKIYEVILTSPTSMLKLYYGKLISLFVLLYPAVFYVVSVYIILGGIYSNIPIEIMLMALLIIPFYMLLYFAFGLYLILRFKNLYIGSVLSLTGAALLIIGSYVSKYLSISINLSDKSIIDYHFLVYASMFLLIGFLITFILIKRFDKENI
jgi:ABC-type Na+ efflux pump permease subunit